jgi:hypothetical protein
MSFSLGSVKKRGRLSKVWWQNFATKETIAYLLDEPQVTWLYNWILILLALLATDIHAKATSERVLNLIAWLVSYMLIRSPILLKGSCEPLPSGMGAKIDRRPHVGCSKS